MVSLKELETYGRAWRVSLPITSSTQDVDLVTPEDYLSGPENIGGQKSVSRRGGITILGVSCWFKPNNQGTTATVTLRSRDAAYLPSGGADDGGLGELNYDIWQLGADSASTVPASVNDSVECAWHLSPANYYVSPQVSGAVLELSCTTNINDGFITVWGIYGQADLGGNKAFSGSPVDFN